MFVRPRFGFVIVIAGLAASAVSAQPDAPPPQTPPPVNKLVLPAPPPPNQVAATVNGLPVYEISVYRAVMREQQGKYEDLRRDALNFLIDNSVVDQYVKRFNIEVSAKEVDQQIDELRKEAKSEKKELEDLLKLLHLSMADLRTQIEFQLRWEKFVEKQTTDETLKNFFDKNLSMFDGSQVNARHILVSAESGKLEDAKNKVTQLRTQILTQVAQELAKLPPGTDALTREKERIKITDKTFADAATKYSDCPSKTDGGNLGWFPRSGAMVEPFARAAFALKPYDISDVVPTSFGYHIILTVDQKAGKQVAFNDVKPIVAHFYGERLREAILRQYKPQAQVAVPPQRQ